MTSSKEHPYHSERDHKRRPNMPLGAAARRTLVSLFSMMLEVPTKAFFEKVLTNKTNLQVLHINCGSGEDTNLMASFLDKDSQIHGIDTDAVLIEFAKQIKQTTACPQLFFTYESEMLPHINKQYDLVYSRLWTYGIFNPQTLITHLYQNLLKNGGILLLEILQASSYKAYPYNHAFNRSMDFIKQLECKKSDMVHPKEHLRNIIHQLCIHKVDIYEIPPAFILDHTNQIPSLMMEYLTSELWALKRTSKEEINALMLELRRYEQEPGTLISRPRVLQFCISK